MVDGPGLRSVVTLAGCSLACPWCQNPGGRAFVPVDIVDRSVCIDCGGCIDGLPCFSGVRKPGGFRMTPEALKERLFADRLWWIDRANCGTGGVTIGGGEPLEHGRFLVDLCSALQSEGVHIAIQTSLGVPCPELSELVPLVSLWQVDLKHADPQRYRDITGVDQSFLIGNLAVIQACGSRVVPRIVLVPGWTDQTEHMDMLASFCSRNKLAGLEFLPYNPPINPAPGIPLQGCSAAETQRLIGVFRSLFSSADCETD